MSCVEASVEPGRKHQNNEAGLADCRVPEVPVVMLEGESMSLSEEKSKVRQFLAIQYPADLEESPVAAPEEAASIGVFAVDLEGEAY